MSDSYQAIYDAVRASIRNGDVGAAITDVCRQMFDISHVTYSIRDEFLNVAYAQQKPSVLFRPTLTLDGDHWCALFGANLQSGVAGFGKSPADAMEAFDSAWHTKLEATK